MSLPVVLRDEAQAEFDEAFDYYEAQQAGLGVDFAERVQQVFDRIAANPKMGRVILADVRKAVVSRFPYCIFYRSDATRVEVIAVFHGSDSTFVLTPATGYHVDSIVVDGAYAGDSLSYRFASVASAHTIRAAFAINVYAITAAADTPFQHVTYTQLATNLTHIGSFPLVAE